MMPILHNHKAYQQDGGAFNRSTLGGEVITGNQGRRVKLWQDEEEVFDKYIHSSPINSVGFFHNQSDRFVSSEVDGLFKATNIAGRELFSFPVSSVKYQKNVKPIMVEGDRWGILRLDDGSGVELDLDIKSLRNKLCAFTNRIANPELRIESCLNE